MRRAGLLPALAVVLLLVFASRCPADDWGDWGSETTTSGPVIKRPFISGWWNWQYNEFSSFDQGRLNFERELDKQRKIVAGVNFNHYTEDNNKKWKVYPGENYYFFKAGDFDYKLGMLIENIGNLVCPSNYDLGESSRVVVASTTEGDDKPIKYPEAYHTADLCVLNKVDLLPYLPFDVAAFEAGVRRVKADMPVLHTSCTTGAGLEAWCAWLDGQVAPPRGRRA